MGQRAAARTDGAAGTYLARTLFDRFPIGGKCLLALVVTGMVVYLSFERIGQVLLLYPVVRKLMRIQIELSLVHHLIAVIVLVLQLTRHRAGVARMHIREGSMYGIVSGVGFRRHADHDHRIGKRQRRFRHTDLQGE